MILIESSHWISSSIALICCLEIRKIAMMQLWTAWRMIPQRHQKTMLLKSLNWSWQPLANDLNGLYHDYRECSKQVPPKHGKFHHVGHEAYFFFSGSIKRVMIIFGNCEPGLRWRWLITIPTFHVGIQLMI